MKRIAKQRDMGKTIARVKRKVFKPVTKLYHTTDQSNMERTTQRDMATACIIENKKIFYQTRDTPPMQESLIKIKGFNVE